MYNYRDYLPATGAARNVIEHNLSLTIRKCCSAATHFGLVPRATAYKSKPGITALVRIRNEPWIEPSLLSIQRFADEIVVVDSSTDDTPRKLAMLRKEYNLDMKYLHKQCDLREASEIALRMATHRWLIKWDGDFVAYTSGERNIQRLKEYITGFPDETFCFIEFPHICLDFDFLSINKENLWYHIEPWLFTFSADLHYEIDPIHGYEKLKFPLYYKRIYLRDIHVMHLRSVKPPLRLLERKYADTYIQAQSSQKGCSFERHVGRAVLEEYGKQDISDVAQRFYQDLKKKSRPLPEALLGEYPVVLQKILKERFNMDLPVIH